VTRSNVAVLKVTIEVRHMQPYRRDRAPHRPPPDMMTLGEIKWWILELRRRGWRQNSLGRVLGFSNPRSIMRKASGKEWFRGGEQRRASRQLRRIVAGELIQREGRKCGRPDLGGRIAYAVIATHPVPLTAPLKLKFDFNWKRGGVHLVPDPECMMLPASKVRSFRALFDNPPKWRESDDE